MVQAPYVAQLPSQARPVEAVENHSWVRWKTVFRVAAIASGLLHVWAYRYQIEADGVSYLDMANAYFRSDWKMAINGYWSPLYSWLLGLPLFVFKPSPYWESTVAHLVNFAIYVVALFFFEFFLKALIRFHQTTHGFGNGGEPLPEWVWWALGYTLFLYSFLPHMLSLGFVTPDLCVAGLVYLAAGILLRLRTGERGWTAFAAFGAVLGIGYLAKTVMFPLAFVFLGTALFGARGGRRAQPRVLIALAMFLLVGGPLVAAISQSKGRLTFGDSGRITYASFVSPIEDFVHWRGEQEGTGRPKHPTRKILGSPSVYEFATPIGGAYPPWYDPSYWNEGVVPHITLKGQLKILRNTLPTYFLFLSGQRELLFGFVMLLLLQPAWGSGAKQILGQWMVWFPAVAALAIYAMVHVEARHVAPFFVLLWAGLFSGLTMPAFAGSRRFVRSVALAVVFIMGARLAKSAGHDLVLVLRPPAHVAWEVADGLQGMGVQPGDKVGSIGTTIFAYWARLARVTIVAEIPPQGVKEFWAASSEVQARAVQAFAKTGAKVVVTDAPPPVVSHPGWQRIGRTDYYAYVVSR